MKNNQKKRTSLSPNEPVPEDIHWEWLEVIKAAQAACKDNQGFAQLILKVSVHRNKPVLWAPTSLIPIKKEDVSLPKYHLLKLSPRRVAQYKMSSSTVAALVAIQEDS